MNNKSFFEKKYFKNSRYFQLIISKTTFSSQTFMSEILDFEKQNKINNWFFINKNNKILLKIKYGKQYKNDFTSLIAKTRKNSNYGIELDVYEPEIYQFGGEKGWDLAIDYFNFVSKIMLENINNYTDKQKISQAIITDLVIRSSNDVWEAWDIIQRIMTTRGIKINKKPTITDKNLKNLLKDPKKYYTKMIKDTPTLIKIIKKNTQLISSLNKNKDDLIFHIRKIIPFYSIFILNIADTSLKDQKKLITSLSLVLNPAKY